VMNNSCTTCIGELSSEINLKVWHLCQKNKQESAKYLCQIRFIYITYSYTCRELTSFNKTTIVPSPCFTYLTRIGLDYIIQQGLERLCPNSCGSGNIGALL